ncbi:DMT family transporter [Pseudorhodoplanes sp.]|uniref:DMT family transporter n=1 Tax=Pseudorhodoplanes sp. TaxID=1934341 RepID=UPI002BEE0BDE|nr:DMT family transporter [Pseudorhodoplanes sp.]HWV54184.1 DMT family transporter [Pseudorhodoplanes sp.]
MPDQHPRAALSPTTLGILCGVAASICWAIGFVAGKHGIVAGLTPPDLAFHRFVWTGILMVPLVVRAGLRDLGGLGWGRGVVILALAGPPQALLNYVGLTLTPLGHGAVIQPGSAALGGLLLAFLILHEKLTRTRLIGVAAILLGLLVLAGEAVTTIRGSALAGDLSFAAAGWTWAAFTICLRGWRTSGLLAAQVVGVLSVVVYVPFYAIFYGFDHMIAAGLAENLLQLVAQGGFAGLLALYLFARAVTALGAGRASVFPALVPPMTMLIGFLALGEVPTLPQLVGLVIVVIGFRFALKP